MKTQNIFLALLASALVFSSCSKEDSSKSPEGRTPVRFTSGISGVVTRAFDNQWEANDQIGIFMIENGEALAAGTIVEEVDNYSYVTTSSGTGPQTFTPSVTSEAAFFPTTGTVDFIAYYPYTTPLTGYSYPVNVTTQTSQKAIDLLWSNNATAQSESSGTVALTFQHKLSKMVFTLVPGTGVEADDLTNVTVTIKGMNRQAPFDLAVGTLGASTDPGDIIALTSGTNSEAIILPAAGTTGYTVEFALNNPEQDVFTWTIVDNTAAFVAGSKYTYNVTINRTGMTITGEITNWTEVGPTDVEAN